MPDFPKYFQKSSRRGYGLRRSNFQRPGPDTSTPPVVPPTSGRSGRALENALGFALIVMVVLTLGINLLRRGGAAETPTGRETIPGAAEARTGAGAPDGPVDSPPGILHEELFAVADAAELSDGGWAVLDPGARRVHVLGPAAPVEARFGGPGGGPGQLPVVVAVATLGDTIVAAGGVDGSLHYFHRSGRFVRKERHPHPDCPGAMVVDAQGAGGGLVILYRCLTHDSPGLEASVRVVRDGKARELVRVPLGDQDRGRVLNPMAFPVMAVSDLGFLLGSHLTPCLEEYDLGGRATGRTVCPPERPRVPLPRSLGMDALQKRAAERAGVRVELPEHLPPFDRVFQTSRGPVFRAVVSERGRALDLMRWEGNPETLMEGATDATFVGESSMLIASAEIDGTRVGIVELERRP